MHDTANKSSQKHIPSNPGNSKDVNRNIAREQTSSDDLVSTSQKKQERNQPSERREAVERESPEAHTPNDPNVN